MNASAELKDGIASGAESAVNLMVASDKMC